MELIKEIEATYKREAQVVPLEEQEQIFHVLAVDDSLIDRKILEKLLKVSSYQVTCVDSGNKALEYLGLLDDFENSNINSISCAPPCACISSSPPRQEGAKVNLIITDYSMPGMSGYDLLRKVKGSSWRDIPVVVMSSENVPARINMCLEGGAEEFLLKPVQLSDLKNLQCHISKPVTHQNLESLLEKEKEEEEEEKEEQENENQSNKMFSKRKALSSDCSERNRPKMEELAVL